jgi:hypothetical protein
MNDWIVVLAWIWLVLRVITLLLAPARIGKPAKPETAEGVAMRIAGFTFLGLPLCGRVIGWW